VIRAVFEGGAVAYGERYWLVLLYSPVYSGRFALRRRLAAFCAVILQHFK